VALDRRAKYLIVELHRRQVAVYFLGCFLWMGSQTASVILRERAARNRGKLTSRRQARVYGIHI